MMHVSDSLGSAGKAMLLAGPIFLASTLAASLYQMLPEPIPVESENVAQMFVITLISVPIGAILACFPVLLGAMTLSTLGKHSSLFRTPITWTISGLLIGFAIMAALSLGEREMAMNFALLVTCAACARIARIGVTWSDVDQSSLSTLTPAVAISA